MSDSAIKFAPHEVCSHFAARVAQTKQHGRDDARAEMAVPNDDSQISGADARTAEVRHES